MLPRAYELVARAQDRLGHHREAIAADRTLLALQPADPPQVHFDLARLLYAEHDPQAKRHVLQALEDTPRFRAAQRLLLEIHDAEKKGGRP
jgi:tetratricopeptide (TPR) repeat protein